MRFIAATALFARALVLGEPGLARMVVGGMLVIAGVALTNRPAPAAR